MERCSDVENLLVKLYRASDLDELTALNTLIAESEATVAIGTGRQDWWTGREAVVGALREHRDPGSGLTIEPGEPVAWRDGTIAWFTDNPTLRLHEAAIGARCTGVAVLENEVWRAVQMHLSIGSIAVH
jgi:hypothetical protein